MNLLKKVAVSISTLAMVSVAFVASPAALNAASPGEVYSTSDGTVWFITKDMQKRPFTSAGAFNSYGFLSFSQVKAADASVEALPTGSFIAPADGRIFCATETKGSDVAGECSLVTGGMKAAFTSAAVFTGRGFSFDRAAYGDSSFLSKTTDISNTTDAHRMGVLVNNGGTVQMVVSGGLWGIPSIDVFNSWGYSFADVVPANSADTAMSQIGVIPGRMAGELVPTGVTGGDDGGSSAACSDDGTEGSVDTYSVGSPNETTIAEDMNDVEVIAFDLELANDGDLCLDRFDLYMGQDNTVTASNKPWDYFTDAHLMVNGEEVDSMSVDSASDWTEYDTGTLGTTSQEYRLRFSGLDAGLTSDEVSTVSVAFDTANNIDSGDEDAVWQFGTETDSFRLTDGTGFTFSDGSDLASSFALEAADTAALELSASSDEPDASVIEVSDTNDTTKVAIGEFEIEETGGVDTNISEIKVTLSSPSSETITDMARKLYLYNGSEMVGQENVTAAAVTFDNIDLDVDADDIVTLSVQADLKDTNDQARYQDGDTIKVSAIDLVKYTDSFDNDENDFTESGSYAGNTHQLRVEGIMVEFVGSSYVKTPSETTGINETVEFTLEFDVTAFGDDMWVSKACAKGTTGTDVDALEVSLDGDTNGDNTTCTDVDSTGTEGTSGFEVQKGSTERFTVTILGNGGEAGGAGSSVTFTGRINGIGFNVGTDGAGDTVYAFEMQNYKSSAVTVFDR